MTIRLEERSKAVEGHQPTITFATLISRLYPEIYARDVRQPARAEVRRWAGLNGPQFWKARRLLIEAGLHPKMEVCFGPYRVDLLLEGLPANKWKSFEKSKRRVRLFGRIIGPIPPQHLLAIEIDGPHHEGNRDAKRDAYLREHHRVYIVRFDASEIEALA